VSCDECSDTGVRAFYDAHGNRWAARCSCGQRATAAWARKPDDRYPPPNTRAVPLSQGGMTSAPKVPDYPPAEW
jgi:hypothetical protein